MATNEVIATDYDPSRMQDQLFIIPSFEFLRGEISRLVERFGKKVYDEAYRIILRFHEQTFALLDSDGVREERSVRTLTDWAKKIGIAPATFNPASACS